MSRDEVYVGERAIADAIGCTVSQLRPLRIAGLLVTRVDPSIDRQARARASDLHDAREYVARRREEHASGPEHGQIVGAGGIAQYLGVTRAAVHRLVASGDLTVSMTTTSPILPRARVDDLDRIRASITKRPVGLPVPGDLPDAGDVWGESRRLLMMARAAAWVQLARRGQMKIPRGERREALAYGIDVPS